MEISGEEERFIFGLAWILDRFFGAVVQL